MRKPVSNYVTSTQSKNTAISAHPGAMSRRAELFWGTLVASVGLLLYALVAMARPEPFTANVDGVGYFLPLIRAITDHWLDGVPLKVLWELGQGWVPWESGQAGYLYPGYLVPALLTRMTGQPMLLLEYSAAFHLALLGAVAWFLQPVRLPLARRLTVALAMVTGSGGVLIGMNWHNYLSPLPWFIGIAGLFFRPLIEGGEWSRHQRLAVLAMSAMFFTASHPQMYVLAFVLITVTAAGLRAKISGLRHVVDLAILQLPFLIPLAYLYVLAQDAAPLWVEARQQANILSTSVPAGIGLAAMAHIGQGPPALLNPMAFLVVFVAMVTRRWGILVVQLVLIALVVPSVLPNEIGTALSSILGGFRWPAKLAVYALPLTVILVIALRPGKYVWWALAAATIMAALNIVLRHHDATSLRSLHQPGVIGALADTRECLVQLGVPRGSRVAFVGNYRYNKFDNGIPLAMQGLANNAPLLVGLESHHLYEPLEPAEVAKQHQYLTIFWRRSLLPHEASKARQEMLAALGVDYLVAAKSSMLAVAGGSSSCAQGVHVVKVDSPRPFPAGTHDGINVQIVRLTGGGLETAIPMDVPPTLNAWRVTAHPDGWKQLPNGMWRWDPSLPAWPWLAGTVLSWILVLAWAVLSDRRPNDRPPA